MKQDPRMIGLKLCRGLLLSGLCLAMSAALAPRAEAGFIESYPLSGFTLTNSPNSQLTNGFVAMQGKSIVLTGGNSGSGESGTTDLLTTALTASQIQFFYSYSSLDLPNQDSGGYLLNGSFFQLAAATGASGVVSFNVTAGEAFGFRVATVDNQFEPGILTISDVPTSGVPEPGTGLYLLLVSIAVLAVGLVRRSRLERGA